MWLKASLRVRHDAPDQLLVRNVKSCADKGSVAAVGVMDTGVINALWNLFDLLLVVRRVLRGSQ